MTHQEIIEMKKFIDIIVETEPIKIAKNYLNSESYFPWFLWSSI